MKNYTVHNLAKLTGITIRTLHYYDEIQLLSPSRVGENGYRYYGEEELTKLQQILFFRELGFSLEQIRNIMINPRYNTAEALHDQKQLFLLEIRRLRKLIKTIDKTIITMKGGMHMQINDLYGGLTKDEIEQYKKEVREKWGEKELRQSEERMKHWAKEDYARVQADWDDIMKRIVAVMDKGIESNEVQAQIERHFAHINQFYDCTLEIYEGLSHLYIDDDRFKKNFEKYKPGLASFVSQAMQYYCKKKRA